MVWNGQLVCEVVKFWVDYLHNLLMYRLLNWARASCIQLNEFLHWIFCVVYFSLLRVFLLLQHSVQNGLVLVQPVFLRTIRKLKYVSRLKVHADFRDFTNLRVFWLKLRCMAWWRGKNYSPCNSVCNLVLECLLQNRFVWWGSRFDSCELHLMGETV